MLVRLIYASRVGAQFGEGDLATVLRQSRQHNPANGITGLLCHADGVFIQVLEGGRDAVNALYNRVVSDPRHRDVTLLAYEEVAERRFAGWTMGQVNLQRLNPGLVLKYGASAKLDPYAMSGAAIASLFDELIASGAIVCS
ncbi:BLUF domain-containing protein [Inhella crocodyli]|jgi:hypothetical protein|uniref:BLUF domain-containing protein n=1 Tax=Inhella crocodyli TaxID=2499851 RepID=A0A437LKP3_9BURK|nr:BLUF domain-containing protein [Inhella crocodyli]RVT85989.1 BLUF domain-containing protein [Inhella crocodyli]